MSMNFLKMFQPKDKVFYSLFETVTQNNVIMSAKLKELVLTNDKEERMKILSVIDNLEHANDETTHNIFIELGKNFITPFDREDIHSLASALDDIADYIYASAKKMTQYNVNSQDSGFHEMVDVIDQSVNSVKEAVSDLRTLKNVTAIVKNVVKINTLENQADDIYDRSIEQLFATETNAIEVIKKREIYQNMEMVTDKCEDAANVIESILVKYA
jgi:uncharacterized protein